MENTKRGQLVTWGLLALIAWELWGRKGLTPGGSASALPGALPAGAPNTPGWIQTLGSSYYENAYYAAAPGEGGPFRFCGGASVVPQTPERQPWYVFQTPEGNPVPGTEQAIVWW